MRRGERMNVIRHFNGIWTVLVCLGMLAAPGASGAHHGYDDLVQLFEDWREFESPPWRNGAPDYSQAHFDKAHKELASYRERLNAIDIS